MEENNQSQNEYVYSTVAKNVYIPPEPPKMRKTPWIIGIILAVLVSVGASTVITLWLMRGTQPPVTDETQLQTEGNTTVEVTEEVTTEEVTTEEVTTEEVTTEEVTTEEVTTEEVTTEEVTTEEVTTEEVTTEEVTTEEVTTEEVTTEEVTTEEVTTPHVHTEVVLAKVAPTCTKTGLTEGKKCSGCSEILEEQVVVPATGHTPGEEATCTQPQNCTVCNVILIAATGHSFDDWYVAKTPTGTEDGEKRRDCRKCDHSEVDSIIPQAFTITSYNRNQIGYVGTAGENLVIPAVFQNGDTWYRVTSIGYQAFDGCSGLTSIEIPDGVTSIGRYAFIRCINLTSIEIPDSVTSIGDNVFYQCTSLTMITVEVGNSVYYSKGNCLIEIESKTLIAGCKSSVIPTDGSVTSIGDQAFEHCTGLASIKIPDGVTSIGDYAFYGCSGLTSIEFLDGVTSIGNHAFEHCTGLTSIEIPDSVTSIGDSAFSSCSGLTSIEIPDSVTSIGDRAFCFCRKLTSIEIPDSVTSIGDYAFSSCESLTSITFEGTMDQWNAITKGIGWHQNVPATEVICSDGTVSLN